MTDQTKSNIIAEFNENSNQTINEIAEKFDTTETLVSTTLTKYFRGKFKK